jgi:hypothetical protein
MFAFEDPNESPPYTTQSTEPAAFVVKTSSDPRPGGAMKSHREDEQVVSEKALDEALEMTFPASDPVAL